MPAKLTGPPSVDRPAIEQQLERVIASPGLQHSEALSNLLRYLVRHSLEQPDEHVKEFQIAVDVLGRRDSFDPRVDSSVRVQTSRLRNKLLEYYAAAGPEDRIIIDIPKGTYTAVFRPGEPQVAPPEHASPWSAGRLRLWMALLAAGVVTVAGWMLAAGFPHAKTEKAVRSDPLAAFWRGFLESDAEPLVVFSNAEFVGRPETGLRYFVPGRDPAEAIFDHYTGVGEVLAIHELDRIFSGLGRPVQVKRGRLLNWDDAQNRNLIFVGSPSENLSLRELSLGKEFRFQIVQGALRGGDLGIVNVHPGPGEQALYFGSRELPITEDYALIELVKGAAPAQSVLLLAGTTTFGTQGAVEFAGNARRMGELLPRIRDSAGRLSPFSALLHVQVNRGVPVDTRLVTLRVAP